MSAAPLCSVAVPLAPAESARRRRFLRGTAASSSYQGPPRNALRLVGVIVPCDSLDSLSHALTPDCEPLHLYRRTVVRLLVAERAPTIEVPMLLQHLS